MTDILSNEELIELETYLTCKGCCESKRLLATIRADREKLSEAEGRIKYLEGRLQTVEQLERDKECLAIKLGETTKLLEYKSERVMELEQSDEYWLQKAREGEASGFLGVEESEKFINEILNKGEE